MRALTLHGPEDLRVESVPEPAIEDPEDAIVRVTLSAVCGSDLHPYSGRESGFDPGTIPGHEMVGEVVAVGRAVERLAVGDRVHAPFTTSCGACRACREGLTSRCVRGQLFGWRQDGAGLHGMQAELVRVPLADSTLVPIAEGLGEVEALLLGDVLPTGWYGAARAGTAPGATIGVVGAGPVGLMAVVAARELGAARVLAFEPVAERRAAAERLGAEARDPGEAGALERVREETEGLGLDGVVEAVGSQASTRLSFDLLRPGATLSSVGVHTRPELGFSPVEAYDKNLTLRFGRCPARALMQQLTGVALSGRWDLASVISHRLPLEQGPDAYRLLAERAAGCLKIVLLPAEAESQPD
jgi:threonine dehydrogenase-like Zn-dependent dehydrogenase